MRSKSEISSLTLYTQSNISSTIATYSKATIALATTDQSRRLIRLVKPKFASTHTIATSPQQMCLEVAVTSS